MDDEIANIAPILDEEFPIRHCVICSGAASLTPEQIRAFRISLALCITFALAVGTASAIRSFVRKISGTSIHASVLVLSGNGEKLILVHFFQR